MNELKWLMAPMSKYATRSQDQEALVSELYGAGNKEVKPCHVSPKNEHA